MTDQTDEQEQRNDKFVLAILKEVYAASAAGDERVWAEVMPKILPANGPPLQMSTGNTPLMMATWIGRLDVADRLISEGCDINHANNKGLTVLQSMVQHLGSRITPQRILDVIAMVRANPKSANAIPPLQPGGQVPDWFASLLRSHVYSTEGMNAAFVAVDYMTSLLSVDDLEAILKASRKLSTSTSAFANSPEWSALIEKKVLAESSLNATADLPVEPLQKPKARASIL